MRSASCSLNSPQVGVGKLTQKKKIILRFHVARGNDSALSQEVWFGYKTEICQMQKEKWLQFCQFRIVFNLNQTSCDNAESFPRTT